MDRLPFLPDDVHHHLILALAQPTRRLATEDEFDFEDIGIVNGYLYSAARVSKLWSEFTLPLLWKNVVVDEDQLQLFLRANQQNPRLAQISFFHVFGFPDVGDTIYLQERDRAVNPWSIVPRLVNLGHLCLPSPGRYLEGIPRADLTELVSLETHLSDNYAHLTSLLELHHLTFLSLHTNFTSAEPLLDHEGLFPNLVSLHLHAVNEWSDNLSQNPYAEPPPILSIFSRLLHVAGTQLLHVGLFVGQAGRFQEDNRVVFDLHKMCPNLETLSLNHVDVLQGVTPFDSVFRNLHTLLLGHPSIGPGLSPSFPPSGHVTEFRGTLSSEEVVASDLALTDSVSTYYVSSDFPSLQRIVFRHFLFNKDHRAEMDTRLVEHVEKMKRKGWKVVDHCGEEWVEQDWED